MYNFKFSVGTNIYFGKGQIDKLGKEILNYSNTVLLVYGGGSIKKNGIYNDVINELKRYDIKIYELGGVDPNPRIESVREGVSIIKENNIGAVLAVGGGSSIDCSKVIAAGIKYDGDPWDLILDRKLIKDAIPVFSVLTLAATGSEMDTSAVISNLSTNQKLGTGSEYILPKASILDPNYTFSVTPKHTAAGVADILSHTFESYFTNVSGGYLQARMAEAILKTCFHYGPIAYNEPDNYEARANIMWASTWAINGLIMEGTSNSWSVHPIEHELSAFYDITHGVGLAILSPHWMRYVLNEKTVDKFVEYGVNVWGINSDLDKYEIANKAIDLTQKFFVEELHIPEKLSDLGITDEYFDAMSNKSLKGRDSINGFVELKAHDVRKIYEASL